MAGADTSDGLRRFFAPRSIALVGATDDLRKFSGRCLNRLVDFGYPGRIFPVNPKYESIQGLRSYPSVKDVPECPDHVGIAVGARQVLGVLDECFGRGVRFATVFSSGFAETATEEGHRLQRDLAEFAHATGMRVMGPNCNGLINFVDRVALTSSGALGGPRRPSGDIGIVCQSGGVGSVNLMWRIQQLGMNVSYVVTSGNDADLSATDFIDFMADDESTSVILAVLEEIKDGDRFISVAEKAAARRKPILLVKVGRTGEGRRGALAHTGSKTGSDIVNDAAFRRAGVIRLSDCDELCEAAMLFRRGQVPRGNRAASLSLSGGNLILLAEATAEAGVTWPALSPGTKTALRDLLRGENSAANPLDLTTSAIGMPGQFARALEIIADDPEIDILLPVVTLDTEQEIESVASALGKTEKTAALIWTGKCLDNPELTPEQLVSRGLAVFRGPRDCSRILCAALGYAAFRNAFQKRSIVSERPSALKPDALAGAQLDDTAAGILALVSSYGVPTIDPSRNRSGGAGADQMADHNVDSASRIFVVTDRDAVFGTVMRMRSTGSRHHVASGWLCGLAPLNAWEAEELASNLLEPDPAESSPPVEPIGLSDLLEQLSWLARDAEASLDANFSLEITVRPGVQACVSDACLIGRNV